MASIDGRKSYLAGSDEVIQYACGPCKNDGEIKESHYYCKDCDYFLCFDCKDEHETFKATKHHSIIQAHLARGVASTVIKGTFAILCSCDQKRAVEVYCEIHMEVICPSCKTIKHRNCKTCLIKDKINKHTKKQLMDLIAKTKSLKAEIESCKQSGEANRKKLDSYKEDCKKDLAAFRREINMMLDKLEKEVFIKVDKVAKQKLQAIEKQIADMTSSLHALNADLDIMNTANKTNNDEVVFSANVKFSKNLSEYGDLIQEIRNGMQSPEMKFHKNTKLTHLFNIDEGLGRIEPSDVSSSHQGHVDILDMKVKSTKEVDIKLPDDSETPYITGCTFLSNGNILLCDNWNKKMKLLDSDMTVKKSLKLSDKPWNVAAVRKNEAIITFDDLKNKDLQYIGTHPSLKLCKKITLPDKCYGLQVVNDDIYACCHKGSGHDEIWRLDRTGNIISKIVLTQSSSGWSCYLGLCLTGSYPRVYLTDWYYDRVTCFQLDDGKMVYQYEDKGLLWPNGIYVDSVGNSIVCGRGSHNVVVITADGRKHGELLTNKDISFPSCVDYRPGDNTLIVGCSENSKFFVYTLGK